MNAHEGRVMLFDDFRGVYIPRDFAQEVDHSYFQGYTQEQVEKLKQTGNTFYDGTNWGEYQDAQEAYHEVWDEILRDAYMVDDEGHTWHLEQEGVLFLVCPELEKEAQQERQETELSNLLKNISELIDDRIPNFRVTDGHKNTLIVRHTDGMDFSVTVEPLDNEGL